MDRRARARHVRVATDVHAAIPPDAETRAGMTRAVDARLRGARARR